MVELSSRANRRRRWWLRAWTVRQPQLPNSSASASTTSATTGRSAARIPELTAVIVSKLRQQFRHDCRVPDDAQLQVRQPWRDLRLSLPLSGPVTIIGQAADCHLQLNDSRLPARHSALIWFEGILVHIRLDGQSPLVSVCRPNQTLKIGSWRTAASWSAPASASSKSDSCTTSGMISTAEPGLDVSLVWDHSTRLPTTIPAGISLVGSHPECAISLPDAGIAAVQAVLLHTEHGLWLADLAGNSLTGAHHHPCELAAIDPGDVVRFGTRQATLSVRWSDAKPVTSAAASQETTAVSAASRQASVMSTGAIIPAPRATGENATGEVGTSDVASGNAAESPLLVSQEPKTAATAGSPPSRTDDWQQFLLEQTTRLKQIQQRLTDLLDGKLDAARRLNWKHFRQLVDDCETHAASQQARLTGVPTAPTPAVEAHEIAEKSRTRKTRRKAVAAGNGS